MSTNCRLQNLQFTIAYIQTLPANKEAEKYKP